MKSHFILTPFSAHTKKITKYRLKYKNTNLAVKIFWDIFSY